MTEHSSEPLVVRTGAIPDQTAERGVLIGVAWLATLLLSKLPLVIARDLLGSDIPWITQAWIGTAILLFATTYVWQAIKPLRGYFVIMGVILTVGFVFGPYVRQTAMWRSLFENQSQMVSLFGDRVLLLMETVAVLAALFLLGIKRREAFLVDGGYTRAGLVVDHPPHD